MRETTANICWTLPRHVYDCSLKLLSDRVCSFTACRHSSVSLDKSEERPGKRYAQRSSLQHQKGRIYAMLITTVFTDVDRIIVSIMVTQHKKSTSQLFLPPHSNLQCLTITEILFSIKGCAAQLSCPKTFSITIYLALLLRVASESI